MNPFFIAITFAYSPSEKFFKSVLFWFCAVAAVDPQTGIFISFVTIRSKIVIITMIAIESLRQISFNTDYELEKNSETIFRFNFRHSLFTQGSQMVRVVLFFPQWKRVVSSLINDFH